MLSDDPPRQRWIFLGVTALLLVAIHTPLTPWLLSVLADKPQVTQWANTLRDGTPGMVAALWIAFYIDVVRRRIDNREQELQFEAITTAGDRLTDSVNNKIDYIEVTSA